MGSEGGAAGKDDRVGDGIYGWSRGEHSRHDPGVSIRSDPIWAQMKPKWCQDGNTMGPDRTKMERRWNQDRTKMDLGGANMEPRWSRGEDSRQRSKVWHEHVFWICDKKGR